MLNRRLFLGLFSALLSSGGASNALLAAVAEPGGWTGPAGSAASAFNDIRRRAAGAGAPQPRAALAPEITDDYDVILPELVDLISALDQQRSQARTPARSLDSTLQDATELLGALANAERSPFTDGEQRVARTFDYEPLRDSYLALYDNCAVRPERAAITNWHIGTLLKPENRSRYEDVEKRLQIPWFVVGIIHSLEAGFNFGGHLHNGDPLRARTWQVPAGRPLEWNPPTDWIASAADALAMKKYDNQPDWSVARMLYRFERYNGFGYRSHGIESPYLWSFSNQYTKGKYVKDGIWDTNAVSRQCGAALLVKELVSRGVIAAPSRV
jgi:lysozyme family protein